MDEFCMIFVVCEEIFVIGEGLWSVGVCYIWVKGSFVVGDCCCCWFIRMGVLNNIEKNEGFVW